MAWDMAEVQLMLTTAGVTSGWARECAQDTRSICRWEPAQPQAAQSGSVGQELDFCSHYPLGRAGLYSCMWRGCRTTSEMVQAGLCTAGQTKRTAAALENNRKYGREMKRKLTIRTKKYYKI